MNSLLCQECNTNFEAKRNDALKCRPCVNNWRKEWAKTKHAKELRRLANRRVREAALAGYGSVCNCCNEDTFEFLAIDHVNGGGRKEREVMSTVQIARKVINENWPDTYQVLCHNCNQAKGWYGICPHEKGRTA